MAVEKPRCNGENRVTPVWYTTRMKTPRVLLATFSQTGTTERAAAAVEAGLRRAGATVVRARISGDGELLPAVDLDSIDILGIGTPVHIFRPPPPVARFVRQVATAPPPAFFLFVLHGTHLGVTGNRIRRRLSRSTDLGYLTLRGEDNFLGYLREGVRFSPAHPSTQELRLAEEFGGTVAERRHRGTAGTEPLDPPTPCIYAVERVVINPFLSRRLYSRFFRAEERCIRCDLCVRGCPTGNITRPEQELPRFARECIMCGRCEQICPVEAIRSPYDWWVNRLFMKLNVRLGIAAGYPYERVDQESTK